MTLPGIRASGRYLVEAGTNKTFHYVGIDAFALFKRWLMPNGPWALVEPILNERKALAVEAG